MPTIQRSWIHNSLCLAILFVSQGQASVLVHETFQDNNILDSDPAVWELRCFGRACSGPLGEVTYNVENEELRADFSGFAMWRLTEVTGTPVEPSDRWSIRARIKSERQDPDESSTVGVGLDSYFWAAPYHNAGDSDITDVGGGRYINGRSGDHVLPYFEEIIVQIDTFPDHLLAHGWAVDSPNVITTVEWDAEPIIPSLPVIWGNFGGVAAFREVVVSTEPLGIGGDFNRDGVYGLDDLEQLRTTIAAGAHDARLNLTSDVTVDFDDLKMWVEKVKGTYFGDSNLDGEFGTSDLVTAFVAGEYEDNLRSNSTWTEGDWNGDGDFSSSDLLLALQHGGFGSGPRAPVPEPHLTGGPLALFVVIYARRRKRTGA